MAAATGVLTRYVCEGETQIDLAVDTARQALLDARLEPQDIDLIISAAAVAYQPIPATAPLIQRALGLADGTCFSTDINCTCLGFATALQFADSLLHSGQYARILIVAAEIESRGLPWEKQPDVAGLFGDGAGAAVVARAPDAGIRASRFCTYPSAYDACSIGAGGTRFDFETEPDAFAAYSKIAMNGKELFRITTKHFGRFLDALLLAADTTRGQVDRVLAHQASPGALAHLIKTSNFSRDQLVDIACEFGNQISASIPFELDHARENGLVKEGKRIVILGTSAGVSFGGLVLDI